MSGPALTDALTALGAAYEAVDAADIDTLTAPQILAALDQIESLGRRLPVQWHRLLGRLQAETTPRELGAKSWKDVLAIRWCVSTTEAHRRLTEAAELGPRQALTGTPLPPLLPAVAAAQAAGVLTPEHVAVLRSVLRKVPGFVDAPTRAQIEVDLVGTGIGVSPQALKNAGERMVFLLDQDGPEPDDTERARTRSLDVGAQGRDAMRPITGKLTPEAWATWEALMAKYAAPGLCNPADPTPCTSGTPSQAQIDNDHRSLSQRRHDALIAIGRIALMSNPGQLNGLPVSIIIRTTLQDLQSAAGVGTPGGGSLLPINDVIRLAAHANHYLAVFDRATGAALDLFRTRRVASAAQRIMLIARDGGCTKPCCTVGAYGSQVHHAATNWANGGNTNINDLGLACGGDHRLLDDDSGWATQINARNEVEWIPPQHLDTGPARVNYHHRPEELLRPPDNPPPPNNPPKKTPVTPEDWCAWFADYTPPKKKTSQIPEGWNPWADDPPPDNNHPDTNKPRAP